MGKAKATKTIRTHEGMEKVEETTSGLIIPIDIIDVAKGVPYDARACAIVQAASRLYGCRYAMVSGNIAHFDFMDPDGVRRIHIFGVPAATRKAITKFDKDGEMPLGGFRFTPLNPSQTTAYRAERNADRDLTGYVPKKPAGPKNGKTVLIDSEATATSRPPRRRDGRSASRGTTLTKVPA